MKVHRTDLVSLVFGLLFLGLSVWWLLAQILGLALPPVGWFLAGALLLIGVLGLVGALRATRHADRETGDAAAAPEPASAPPTGEAYRWDGPDTADLRIEGPERATAPVWEPDEPTVVPEPPYRPAGEADEWPTGAVTDRALDAVQDRPADAPDPWAEDPGEDRPGRPPAGPVTGPPAGEHRPPA